MCLIPSTGKKQTKNRSDSTGLRSQHLRNRNRSTWVQSHFWLHSKSEDSLRYIQPCLKRKGSRATCLVEPTPVLWNLFYVFVSHQILVYLVLYECVCVCVYKCAFHDMHVTVKGQHSRVDSLLSFLTNLYFQYSKKKKVCTHKYLLIRMVIYVPGPDILRS